MKVSLQRLQASVLGVLVIATLVTLGWSMLNHFGSDDPFMPHAHCYLMKQELILLHGLSDLFIGASYVAISGTLTFLVMRARREIPFHWMMLAFATFIVACGATHLMEVWTLSHPNPPYWLSGDIKLVTALASVATAVLLPPLIPKVLLLLQEARMSSSRKEELERANRELTELYDKVRSLDQLKTSFFANVSHELRTPLALIFGPVDRLMERKDIPPDAERDLQVIRRNALVLHKHVDDILDLSKLEASRMDVNYREVNLPPLVRMVLDFFTSSNVRPINVEIRTPISLRIQADPEKIERILFNLLSNAFKFTPAGGSVSVVVERDGENAVIRVNDSGPGVPPHLREVIFERFRQGELNKAGGGTGLGLSIAREFAELHQGSLHSGEAPGGGASFELRLPLKAPTDVDVAPEILQGADYAYRLPTSEIQGAAAIAQVEASEPQENLQPAQGPEGAPSILVVEDNIEMAELIVGTLVPDYRVRTVRNGSLALSAMGTETPDLVLTDLMMPGMTGDELLLRLREDERFINVPVILLTAKADEEAKLRVLQQGAQDYLVKPFALDELRVRIRNQIATKQARDTLQQELVTQERDIAQLAREVTRRARELERARQEAEAANRAKDQFLAILSHELRTPLTPALALAINLENQEQVTPSELKEGLSVIRRNIELEARLIDDLLDLTRIAKGKLQLLIVNVDVHDAIRSALDMCQSEIQNKQSHVDLELGAKRHNVCGDASRLLQVIWNLLLNAVKFTPADGRIIVRTFNAGTMLVVEVSDTGVGIDPSLLARIFEPFEQGEHRVSVRMTAGLGLGLAVVKGLVEAHGGRIAATSLGRGLGATFRVELETIDTHAEEADSPPSENKVPARHLRILLVEDHVDTREAMLRLLGRWGYTVETAGSLAEAREKVAGAEFDVLVSDLGLPDGPGTDLMAELRERTGIIGIAMSGFGMEEDIQKSHEAGFSEHLTKPVAAQRLKAALEKIAVKI